MRITDVNYGGHAGNDALVGLLHEARLRWIKKLGFTSELLAPPVGLIMVDLAVRFKAEAGYGDVLTIRIAPQEATARGFHLVYQAALSDGREVVRAQTGFVFFDYDAKRMASLPPDLLARFEIHPA